MATEAQCEACGETNASDAAFCLFCGAYLGWDKNSPAATAAPPPAAAPVAPQASAPTVPTSAPVQPATTRSPGPAPDRPAAPPPTAGPPVSAPPTPTTTPTTTPTSGTATGSPARPGACPACGHVNEPGRRFCGRCGQLLAPLPPQTAPTRPLTAQPGRGWWIFGDPSERAAKRAYRRSLPPLYRWRRVIVTLLVLAGAVGLLAALTGDPVTWTRQRWYDVTGTTEPLEDVTAEALPEGSVLKGYSVSSLVDDDERTAWATSWPDATVVSSGCGRTPGVGAVRLSWDEPVRLRGLEVSAGLDQGESARDAQYRPRRLDVQFGNQCTSLTLEDRSGPQTLELDTGTPVTSIVLSVGDVKPATGQAQQDVVALSGVRLLVRPE